MRTVEDAIALLKRHPDLIKVGGPQEVAEGIQEVEILVRVALPSREQHQGISSTNVKDQEPAWLTFYNWPAAAPQVWLREDFPLNLPHINQHRPGRKVSPCLFDGSPDELLHRFGLARFIDQLVEWLTKAASGQLIDLAQGWEPTRRDNCPGNFVFEAELANEKTPNDGTLLLTEGTYFFKENSYLAFAPELDTKSSSFSQEVLKEAQGVVHGEAQVIWARGVNQNKSPVTIDTYEPETVRDLDTLLERATRLGVNSTALSEELKSYFFRAAMAVPTGSDATHWKNGLLAFVVLLVQRPAPVIWTRGRTVEMLPYLVRMKAKDKSSVSPSETVVEPLWHAEQVSPKLLAMTSGFTEDIPKTKLVFVGCGSLGSKVGMHLGRAGFGNAAFVDNEAMGPHNVARHALIPRRIPTAYPEKAVMMAGAFQEMGHGNATAHVFDATLLFKDQEKFTAITGDGPSLIIDSTASLKVESSATSSSALSAGSATRLARASMFAKGRAAVLYLEGTGRSCTTEDLKAALFDRCRTDPALRSAIGGDSVDPVRIFVGDNCRSVTMTMSDSVVSRSAALIGHQVEKWLSEGLPTEGTLCFGTVEPGGVAMDWRSMQLGPTTVLQVSEAGGWTVRILASVAKLISEQSLQSGVFETGGMLIGHIPPQSRTIIIGGIVAAPSDSLCSPQRFVLGIENRRADLRQAHQDSLGHLQFVGTWHSHPMGGPHSDLDRLSLQQVAQLNQDAPVVSLVSAPEGFAVAVSVA